MSTNPDGERILDIDEARVNNLKVRRVEDEEDRRAPWIVVGIGLIMLVLLIVTNGITLFQNHQSEVRQDRLSECFRRVIVTINARTEYNEQLRKVEAALADAPAAFVEELGKIPSEDTTARLKARDRYLKRVEGLKTQRTRILDKQAKFQYPALSDCEKT